MKNTGIKLAFLYLSAIIGAGFVTGREILTYFAIFGFNGLWGLLLAFVLLAICGTKIYLIVYSYGIRSPYELNTKVAGKRIGSLITVLSALFSYCLYVITLSGLRSLSVKYVSILNNKILQILLVLLFSLLSLYISGKDFKVLANICSISAPLIALFIGILSLPVRSIPASNMIIGSGPLSIVFKAFLYTGYNTIVAVAVLGRTGNMLKSKKQCITGGVVGALLFAIFSLPSFIAIVVKNIDISVQMPVLLLSSSLGEVGEILFPVLLFLTMAVSVLAGLSGCFASLRQYTDAKAPRILLSTIGIPLSFVAFGTLMDFIYPIFGFAGVFLMILLALYNLNNV